MRVAATQNAVSHLSAERNFGVALPEERTAFADLANILGDSAAVVVAAVELVAAGFGVVVVVAAAVVAAVVVLAAASIAFEPFVVAVGKPAVEG